MFWEPIIIRMIANCQVYLSVRPDHIFSGPHGDDDERIYHAYYQWVPLMLFFQAICFYAPHWIWKQCDNGKIKVRSLFDRGR